MSAVLARTAPALRAPQREAVPELAVVLVGTGLVGGAVLRRLVEAPLPLRLVGVANSRHALADAGGLSAADLPGRLQHAGASDLDAVVETLRRTPAATRVLIDATPSAAVAARHAAWLAAGVHVVSANKLALGGDSADWQALQDAARTGRTRYGDAATVGAGLPVLASLRRLRRCHDAVLGIEGVFSGSLSFLFNRLDAGRPFSRLLAEAFERGYTEPDPRADLSGADVARKLLILCRAAGHALEPGQIAVHGLVPEELAALPLAEFTRRLPELDAQIEARRRAAAAEGKVLRYLARFTPEAGAEVGLAAVAPTHPAAALDDAENLFALRSARYAAQPLVVRGPGAGADVTAQALLADALEIAAD